MLESTADAVLVIGDRAMKVPHEPFHEVVDLAEAWHNLTGLPFVFALWVARGGRGARRPARSPGAQPRRGAGPCGRTGPDARAPAGTRFRDVLRLPDSQSCPTTSESPRSPGCGGSPPMAARLGLAPEGVSLVFHRRRDLAPRR